MKDKIAKKEGLKGKLSRGLDLAYKRVVVEKCKKQQKVVVWKEGKVVTITP